MEENEIKKKVISALKECYDPELPVNIYDLGLIYKIDIKDEKTVDIVMTLTSPFCPISDYFFEDIKDKLRKANIENVNIDLTFDPPWTKDKMSDEAKAILDEL